MNGRDREQVVLIESEMRPAPEQFEQKEDTYIADRVGDFMATDEQAQFALVGLERSPQAFAGTGDAGPAVAGNNIIPSGKKNKKSGRTKLIEQICRTMPDTLQESGDFDVEFLIAAAKNPKVKNDHRMNPQNLLREARKIYKEMIASPQEKILDAEKKQSAALPELKEEKAFPRYINKATPTVRLDIRARKDSNWFFGSVKSQRYVEEVGLLITKSDRLDALIEVLGVTAVNKLIAFLVEKRGEKRAYRWLAELADMEKVDGRIESSNTPAEKLPLSEKDWRIPTTDTYIRTLEEKDCSELVDGNRNFRDYIKLHAEERMQLIWIYLQTAHKAGLYFSRGDTTVQSGRAREKQPVFFQNSDERLNISAAHVNLIPTLLASSDKQEWVHVFNLDYLMLINLTHEVPKFIDNDIDLTIECKMRGRFVKLLNAVSFGHMEPEAAYVTLSQEICETLREVITTNSQDDENSKLIKSAAEFQLQGTLEGDGMESTAAKEHGPREKGLFHPDNFGDNLSEEMNRLLKPKSGSRPDMG